MLTTILMSLTATLTPVDGVTSQEILDATKLDSQEIVENRRTSTKKLSYSLAVENRRTSKKKLSYERVVENRRTSKKKL